MKKRFLIRLFAAILLPFAAAISILSVIQLSRAGASFPSLAAVLIVTLSPLSATFFFSGRPEAAGADSSPKHPGCLFLLFAGLDGLIIFMLLGLLAMDIRLLIPLLHAVL